MAKGKSVDAVLNELEEISTFAQNVVPSAMTMGQNAYYKEGGLQGIDPQTGKLNMGNLKAGKAAAIRETARPMLKHVYTPNGTDADIQGALNLMADPDHAIYSGSQFGMMLGDQAGPQFVGTIQNSDEPISAPLYSKIGEQAVQGGIQNALGAIQSRSLDEDDLSFLETEARKAADANPNYDIGPGWNTGAAIEYLQQTTRTDGLEGLAAKGALKKKGN